MSGLLATLLTFLGGYLLARLLVAPRRTTELVAWTLLFAATAIPFLSLATALALQVRISVPLLVAVGLVTDGAAGALLWRRRPLPGCPGDRSDLALLAGAGIVVLFSAAHYSDGEAWLSLASYATRGEAKCFHHATFQLVDELNPGTPFRPLEAFYGIISTPGNTVLSAPFVAMGGVPALRAVYAAVQALVYLFVALLALHVVGRPWIAILAGLVAVFHPYALSVEVLDRNTLALALTAALVCALERLPDRPALHGWLFGLAAGTGLRFLPLLNAIAVGALYLARRAPPRAVATFLGVAVATFALNLPHLAFHGFHSLGEELPLGALVRLALQEGTRAPFQPLPAGLQILQHTLGALGALGVGLVALGLWTAWRRHRRAMGALVAILLVTSALLAVQRDGLESDKLRIPLWAWLPVPLAIALAVQRLTEPRARSRALAVVVCGAVGALGLDAALARVDAPVDATSDTRKPVYQTDTPAFAGFYRARCDRAGVLPGYDGLGDKLDLARKRRTERQVMARLSRALGGWLPSAPPWAQRALKDAAPTPAPTPDLRPLTIRVDLERLVTAPEEAVRRGDDAEPALVDLVHRADLLDIHYRQARVSWQPEPLPVAIFPDPQEVDALRELAIHLNAYTSFGPDDDGFLRINSVSYAGSARQHAAGHRGGLRALPHPDEDSALVVRVPQGYRVVVHYWVVSQAKGTPFRVDSWLIEEDGEGGLAVSFRCREPESYL